MQDVDPFDIVLGAIKDAPPAFIKAIVAEMETLRTRVFLTPDAAWSAIGSSLREHVPDLVKSYPGLIRELSERIPGPGVMFVSPPMVPGSRSLGLVRMVREE